MLRVTWNRASRVGAIGLRGITKTSARRTGAPQPRVARWAGDRMVGGRYVMTIILRSGCDELGMMLIRYVPHLSRARRWGGAPLERAS